MWKKIKAYLIHVMSDDVPVYENVTAILSCAMGAVSSPLAIHFARTLNWQALLLTGIVLAAVFTCNKWWPMVRLYALQFWKYLTEKDIGYPSPEFVCSIAYDFLVGAINTTGSHIRIFQTLFYDDVPITGSETVMHYPRAKFELDYHKGVPVYRVALFRISGSMFGVDALRQDAAVLQSLLGRFIEDGDLSLGDHPICYVPNLPTLCLLDITEQGSYTYFDFVWVNNEKAAEVVSHYGVPPVDDDTDDFDF